MDSNHRSLAKSRGSRQVDILQILAGRPSGYPTVGHCGDVRFRALVKGSMAWLLCLPVGQASSLASSCCSTLFLLTRPKAGLSARDQRFESGSLQQGVRSEPCGTWGSRSLIVLQRRASYDLTSWMNRAARSPCRIADRGNCQGAVRQQSVIGKRRPVTPP
jgi:hypothetical protein